MTVSQDSKTKTDIKPRRC